MTHKSLASIFDIQISVRSIVETGSFSTETGFEVAILRWKADFKVPSGQYAGDCRPNRFERDFDSEHLFDGDANELARQQICCTGDYYISVLNSP
ncbi:MAG: hypothetical protein G4V63_16195 [Candidatus Afipia apatlaquensis]|uniref:Uncharacterized protein n=1 Tax=Candidatus Afipia apatlaquensis TaxID=2712852 RepID=A0A7C9VNW5_9BRAD|nr:hypothetical protein [Candidatus Afipia apatlaquensis]